MCNANVGGGIASECAVGGLRYNGGANMGFSPPFNGAQLWGSIMGAGGTTVIATNVNALTTTLDTTVGHSGSPIFAFLGSQYRVIGVVSNHLPGTPPAPPMTNFAARWTSTVHNFVDANSPFPADAM